MAGVWLELSFFVMVTRLKINAHFCMAKHWMRESLGFVLGVLLMAGGGLAFSQPADAGPQVASAASAASTPLVRPRPLVRVPRVIGRLHAGDLGLVINTADPYSVEVGEYYRRVRRIPDGHVLRIDLPVQPRLAPADLERLRRRIDEHFDGGVQALALAWTQPYAVECQSITSAVTLGFDAQACVQSCGRRTVSPYFNAASAAPFKDLGLRPSMLLAASDVDRARRLIDRGAASDHTLGLVGAAPVQAHFMTTADAPRSVRAALFPPAGLQRRIGLDTHLGQGDLPRETSRVVLVQTGVAQFLGAEAIDWVPGALADHLTSFGGQLDRTSGQSTVLDWLDAGATASYGTVSEPCNHLQKFPHPQILLLHYLQGSTALEAYWKSVAWPQQGVFVGEPLAAPFSRQ
jgi:uncharacterized protein (TIGR03790 family)